MYPNPLNGLRALTLGVAILATGPAWSAAPPAKVIVAVVQEQAFADPIEALGTLKARESIDVTATVSETVTAIHFDDGERVEAGRVLIEMTDREEHALLAEARATKNEAYRQFRRIKSLQAQGTAAESLLDQRRSEWETAKARLSAIESRLADRLIKAPFSGIVGLRDLSVGALVEPGDVITTLDDDSVMKIEFPVPSTYLSELQVGQELVATTRAWPDRVFNGKLKSVSSRIDPITRAVRVRGLLPNPDQTLKPGLLMQVELQTNQRNTLVIPEDALVPLDKNQFVLKVDEADGNRVVRQLVEIGGRRPGKVEILQGLESGDKVISHGTLKVRPGQTVTIVAVDDGSTPLPELLQSLSKAKPAK